MAAMGLSKSLVTSILVFVICMYTPSSSSMSSPGAKTLKVGVPCRPDFREYVSVNTEDNGSFTVGGFCVEVFEAAMQTLNYSFEYILIEHTNGVDLISFYDYGIHQIVLKKLDAVVGDFTITSKRSKDVQFAQPYFDSGLVAVVPMKDQHFTSFGWAFTKPFTAQMWLLTVGFFISGGIVLYILERKNNPRFQGKPDEQFGNVLWFSFSTWFTNQDDIRTVMGRVVVVAWFFVIGILYSCYTANLSAILTASRLEPTLNDIRKVVSSTVRIGYQFESTVADILVEHYGVSRKRLVPLNEGDYYNALSRGTVGAIVDERPYMQSLVANNCHSLAFAGQTFVSLNWGFAFDRTHYQLVRDISVKILELSEKGELLKLQQQWLPYYDSDCSKYRDQSGSSQLHVAHFWGLFAISWLVSAIVLLFYMVHWKWNSSRVASSTPPPAGSSGPNSPQEDSNSPQEGSSDQGGGSCSPDQVYRRSLELTKNIQFQRRTKSLGNSMLQFHGI